MCLAAAWLLALPGTGAAKASTRFSTSGTYVPAWTTYHYNGARSGVDPDPSPSVSPTERWQSPALDGKVFAEPLILGNRVYVATENDTVYALDASTGAIIWQTHVATAVPATDVSCAVDSNPTWGITSTPVIDKYEQRIYVVGDTWDGSKQTSIAHEMFGLNLSNGSIAVGPVHVDPPTMPSGDTPRIQLQRTGLALDKGRIIFTYGGYTDCGPYHGWVVSVPENGGKVESFETETRPADDQGGIFASGIAPPIDSNGDVWVATGNGNCNSSVSGSDCGEYPDYGESVLKLDPDMNLLDWWTPSNWYYLDTHGDGGLDLDTSMPLLLPNGLVFQIGKQGVGNILSAASLGQTGAAPLFSTRICSAFGGGNVFYNGVIYVDCRKGGLFAETLDQATDTFAPLSTWTVDANPDTPPIVAGGRIWAVDYLTGYLYGIGLRTGAVTYSIDLGGFEAFTTPSAAGGLLFVANEDQSAPGDDQVTAFQIQADGACADRPFRDRDQCGPVASRLSRRSSR